MKRDFAKQKGYRIDGREEFLTILKSRPLLLQTNPAYKEWEARRIMKKVGRAKWWALVSDLNSNAAENGNKKATSLRYQPLYHAFLPYILPFLLCHSPFFLSPSLSPLLPSSFVNSVLAIYSLVGHCVRFTTQRNGSSLSLFALFLRHSAMGIFTTGILKQRFSQQS